MRLFVAIELEKSVRSVLHRIQTQLGARCDGVRWVPAQQLHLTVRFIGEVKDSEVNDLAAAVTRAARACRGFQVNVGGAGCFPLRGPVRVIWAGVKLTDDLKSCASTLEEELSLLGVEEDRKRFSPHITLGRVRQDRSGNGLRLAVNAVSLARMSQPARSLTLMSSTRTRTGPVYMPACCAQLGQS